MYRFLTKLIIILILTLTIAGCSGTRELRSQEVQIDKIEIFENKVLLKNDPVNFIITTPTNKKILGIPVAKILYEAAHPDPTIKFNTWLAKKENRIKPSGHRR